MFEVTEETTKAQLIQAINEDDSFDCEGLAQIISFNLDCGSEYIEHFWKISDLDYEDWSETIGLDGRRTFNAIRFGTVNFQHTYITFDGYANLETFNYPQLKETLVDELKCMDEEKFEELMELIEGDSF